MTPRYSSPFALFVKKQSAPFRSVIEDSVEQLCAQPYIGEEKTGDLRGIWVYKFTYNRQQFLIAYRPPTKDEIEAAGVHVEFLFIDFYRIGAHENFYANLKKYLKS